MPKKDIDETLYGEMLAAWLEKPSFSHVAEQVGVSRRVVERVVKHGVPEKGLDPFPSKEKLKRRKGRSGGKQQEVEIPDELKGSSAAQEVMSAKEAEEYRLKLLQEIEELEHKRDELAEISQVADANGEVSATEEDLKKAERQYKLEKTKVDGIEQKAVAQHSIKKAADEATAARYAMHSTVTVATILSHVADRFLEGIEEGEIMLPEKVDMKTLTSLANSADKITSALDKAIKIHSGRGGQPENNVGLQIGVLLDNCDEEELDHIINTGQLPPRLMQLSGDDSSE